MKKTVSITNPLRLFFETVIIFISMIFISGCGAVSGKTDTGIGNVTLPGEQNIENTTAYKAEFRELSLPEDMISYSCMLLKDSLYYYVPDYENSIETIKKYDIDSQESTVYCTMTDTGESTGLNGFFVRETGTVTAVGTKYLDDIRKEYYLTEYDINGKIVNQQKMKTSEADEVYSLVVMGEDRNICIGQFKGSSCSVMECDKVSGELRDLPGLPSEYALKTGYDRENDKILICTEKFLYSYDCLSQESAKILNWQEVDIEPDRIGSIEAADGKICVFIRSMDNKKGSYAVISPKDSAEEEMDPQVIKLFTVSATGNLKSAVADFNRQQSEYRVEINEYNASNVVEDNAEKMVLDILGDNSCDILDVSSLGYGGISYDDLFGQGYVVNLESYIEASEVLSMDDFEEKALELCRTDEGLYAIPYTYTIKTCIVDGTVFDEGSASVKAIMEYDREHEDKSLFEEAGEYDVLVCMVYDNLDYFVDNMTGECNFETDAFKEIVTYSKDYAGKGKAHSFGGWNKEGDILNYVWIENIESVQSLAQVNFHGNGRFVGMPSIEGSLRPIITMSPEDIALSITKNSEHKEGAWKFIEYCLTWEPEMNNSFINLSGIPSNKSLEKKIINLLSKEDGPLKEAEVRYGTQDDYVIADQYPFTEQDEEEFRRLIENAKVEEPGDRIIWSIIDEELGAYYADQRSLDDAIKIIQSRVSLYLAENR